MTGHSVHSPLVTSTLRLVTWALSLHGAHTGSGAGSHTGAPDERRHTGLYGVYVPGPCALDHCHHPVSVGQFLSVMYLVYEQQNTGTHCGPQPTLVTLVLDRDHQEMWIEMAFLNT